MEIFINFADAETKGLMYHECMGNQLSRSKVRQCLTSLISRYPRCHVCGDERVELHHIFGGPLRILSEHYGLTVMLCPEHHRGKSGVHGGNKELDEALKKEAREAFCEYYGEGLFEKLFGSEPNPVDSQARTADSPHIGA